jgi:hypothetical protein
MFATRVLPTPTFESYTPAELQLVSKTLQRPAWVAAMQARLSGLRETDLDRYFREYINRHFPLSPVNAGPDAFEQYVASRHRQVVSGRDMQFATQQQQLWWASHPQGQRFAAYPGPDFAGDEAPLDMDRFYNFPSVRPYFTPVPPPPPLPERREASDLPRDEYDRLW